MVAIADRYVMLQCLYMMQADVHTGNQIYSLPLYTSHGGPITSLCWSPVSHVLVYAMDEKDRYEGSFRCLNIKNSTRLLADNNVDDTTVDKKYNDF